MILVSGFLKEIQIDLKSVTMSQADEIEDSSKCSITEKPIVQVVDKFT